MTASVVGLRSGEYRKEASLHVDGQGPGLHLLHPLHRVAHGGSFSWTSSGNRKRRRLRSGEYRKEATAAVGTGRTWAFRGGPGPSLIGKAGRIYQTHNLMLSPRPKTPTERPPHTTSSRVDRRPELTAGSTHTTTRTENSARAKTRHHTTTRTENSAPLHLIPLRARLQSPCPRHHSH